MFLDSILYTLNVNEFPGLREFSFKDPLLQKEQKKKKKDMLLGFCLHILKLERLITLRPSG